MYYLIHHNLQLNGSTSITFPDMVIFSSTCFWTPISVIFWGMCTTKDICPRKYRYIYIAILLSNPFFYGLINIFIFYCHWWSKGLSLTFPFQLPSRSVAATLKPSHMNQQLRIPSKTLTALFFTYHHKINSPVPLDPSVPQNLPPSWLYLLTVADFAYLPIMPLPSHFQI